jgi:hypothetical protein
MCLYMIVVALGLFSVVSACTWLDQQDAQYDERMREDGITTGTVVVTPVVPGSGVYDIGVYPDQ